MAIAHLHAKYVGVDEGNLRRNRMLFRTVVKGARRAGVAGSDRRAGVGAYGGVLVIEHEEFTMAPLEGLRKSVAVLTDVVSFEQAGRMLWT